MIYQLQQTRGAAEGPLSSEQRQKLAAMAHYAYREATPEHQGFDEWRLAECLKVVGKPGLTHCCNGDYNPLKAHFLDLAGRPVPAFRAALKAASEPRQWAMFSLMKECTAAKDVMPEAMKYARGFVRNKRGVALEDADAKTIWHAIFTVKRKAQLERKKKRATAQGGMSAGAVLDAVMGKPARRKTGEEPF